MTGALVTFGFISRDFTSTGAGYGFQLESALYFGKHKGSHIDQVDDGYLKWMIKTFPEFDSWWKTAASALTTRQKMKRQQQSAKINVRDLLSDLKSCTRKRDLQKGKRVHANAVEAGMDSNIYIAAALINMYAKCDSMLDARIVFDSIEDPDVVSWTALILGYADNGQGFIALVLFSTMKAKGRCVPDSMTYLAALKACTSLAHASEAGKRTCLERGRQIHLEIGHRHMDHFVQSVLINLYAKCGSMEDARTVFDSIQKADLVCWNALILGYADNGQGAIALDLFSRMKDEGRCAPDSMTYVAALKACTSQAADADEAGRGEYLEKGRYIHSKIGCHMDHFVQNTLINLYAKCGSMDDAKTVFDSMQKPDVVSWTSLIQGYADNGKCLVALDLFSMMNEKGKCAPNSLTYLAAIIACCSIGALTIGRQIHSAIREFDSRLVTCLVDFYAKCGSVEEAREVFDLHPRARDVSTWNALLAGYARFGDTASVFSFFETMQDQGFQPDDVTFVCMLSCCSHAGLIAKAWEYLEVMSTRYKVTPTVMHYNCMIDLLGRANKLDEAVALLQKMYCDPDAVTWKTLLAACCKWKNAKIGRWAFKCLMDLDHKIAPGYVLIADIYGSRGMWEEQSRVWETNMKFYACKLPGRAYVGDELGKMVEFVEEDPANVENNLELEARLRSCGV